MRKLPVLHKATLILSSPCTESFEAMPLRGRGRHCDACSKTVIDMTRMTRREAEALFDANESLCGYVLSNEQGETFFPARETSQLFVEPPRFASVLATGLTAALLLAGCGAEQHPAAPVAVMPTAPPAALMMPSGAKQNGPETEVLETVAVETVPCEAEAPTEAEPMSDEADAGPAPRPRPVPRPGGIRRPPR